MRRKREHVTAAQFIRSEVDALEMSAVSWTNRKRNEALFPG
jgi:hypothetical protein